MMNTDTGTWFMIALGLAAAAAGYKMYVSDDCTVVTLLLLVGLGCWCYGGYLGHLKGKEDIERFHGSEF